MKSVSAARGAAESNPDFFTLVSKLHKAGNNYVIPISNGNDFSREAAKLTLLKA